MRPDLERRLARLEQQAGKRTSKVQMWIEVIDKLGVEPVYAEYTDATGREWMWERHKGETVAKFGERATRDLKKSGICTFTAFMYQAAPSHSGEEGQSGKPTLAASPEGDNA